MQEGYKKIGCLLETDVVAFSLYANICTAQGLSAFSSYVD